MNLIYKIYHIHAYGKAGNFWLLLSYSLVDLQFFTSL